MAHSSKVTDLPAYLSRTLQEATDFVRRRIKPKPVVEAEKRRKKRKARATGRRLTRAATVGGVSAAGIAGFGLAMAPVGATGLVAAGTAAFLATCAALFWPASPAGGGRISRKELIALVADAEEWLLQKRTILPVTAIPPLDAIFFRLNDLHPYVASLDPHGTTAWDMRRLLGEHLPRLIHSYASLPATVHRDSPELLQRMIDGLGTLDQELARICREASQDHLTTFEVQERFIEIRYKDAGSLKVD
jgi:hypothetical protein